MNPAPTLVFLGTGPAGLDFAASSPRSHIAIFVLDWDDLDRTRLTVLLAGQHRRIKVHHVGALTPFLLARFPCIYTAA
jgi:hypothetical protein